MYDLIDLEELTRMANLGEAAPPELFDMATWRSYKSCGTKGCLIGTWCVATPCDRLKINHLNRPAISEGIGFMDKFAIAKRFNLYTSITTFLFIGGGESDVNSSMYLSQQDAVARLRKYVRHVEDMRRRWANHEWLMRLPRRERLRRLGVTTTSQTLAHSGFEVADAAAEARA